MILFIIREIYEYFLRIIIVKFLKLKRKKLIKRRRKIEFKMRIIVGWCRVSKVCEVFYVFFFGESYSDGVEEDLVFGI